MSQKIKSVCASLVMAGLLGTLHATAEQPAPVLDTSQFIAQIPAQKKGGSKQQLKEDIGEEIKQALHQCAALTKAIGQMQVVIANVQSQLFEKVEELIDNKSSFKKAGRPQLKSSLQVLSKVTGDLGAQVRTIHQMKVALDGDACLKQSKSVA